MKRSTHLLHRSTVGLITIAVAVGLCLAEAQAAVVKHSLSGNGRVQIGDGLPIPISFGPPPNGKILAIPGAIASQTTTGPDPKDLRVPPGQLRYGTILPSGQAGTITDFAAPRQNLGVWQSNSAVFEVATQIAIYGGGVAPPVGKTFWQAGGRTGASIVAFCPGQTVPPAGNPNCLNTTVGNPIDGLMRYTKTANQFGGPGQSRLKGAATVVLNFNNAPHKIPGTYTARFAFANPASKGAGGMPFGGWNVSPGAPPNPSGNALVKVNANGTILSVVASNLGPGIPNPGTSYGAPWTTGKITVQAPANPPESFIFQGADNRVSGVGSISLVAASVSNRLVSGPNANRNWTNLVIGSVVDPVPSMSSHALAAVFGLLALAGGYALQRRIRS